LEYPESLKRLTASTRQFDAFRNPKGSFLYTNPKSYVAEADISKLVLKASIKTCWLKRFRHYPGRCFVLISQSILFKRIEDRDKKETLKEPVITDLNLNQIINTITEGKEEYNLEPFFLTSLSDLDAIQYRLEIMRDLENQPYRGINLST